MMTEKMALPAWARGWLTVANYRLTPERVGYAAELYRPLVSWRDVSRLGVQCRACYDPHEEDEYLHRAAYAEDGGCELARYSLTGNRPCVLLVDEISSAFPSRGAMDMPAELARMLHQFRKPMVLVGWSGVSFQRADVILREATQYVSVSRGYFPDRFQRDERNRVLKDGDGKKLRSHDSWGANRLFRWKHFNAMDMERFTLGEDERIRAVKSEWYWRPGHKGYLAYRTSDQVLLLDHVDQVGVCSVCSGVKRRQPCKCDHDPRAAMRVAGRSGEDA